MAVFLILSNITVAAAGIGPEARMSVWQVVGGGVTLLGSLLFALHTCGAARAPAATPVRPPRLSAYHSEDSATLGSSKASPWWHKALTFLTGPPPAAGNAGPGHASWASYASGNSGGGSLASEPEPAQYEQRTMMVARTGRGRSASTQGTQHGAAMDARRSRGRVASARTRGAVNAHPMSLPNNRYIPPRSRPPRPRVASSTAAHGRGGHAGASEAHHRPQQSSSLGASAGGTGAGTPTTSSSSPPSPPPRAAALSYSSAGSTPPGGAPRMLGNLQGGAGWMNAYSADWSEALQRGV